MYQSWQYSEFIMNWHEMTWRSYKMIFLKDHKPAGFEEQLQMPDYYNSLKFGIEYPVTPIKSVDPTSLPTEKDIKSKIEYIRSDKNWMNSIKEKARNKNQPVDSVLRWDAEWSLQN